MDSTASTPMDFEQNQYILDMAFDHLSLEPGEKEKIIKILEKNARENVAVCVTDILKQENLVSEEALPYLIGLEAYLKTRCLDQQFAKIAAANQLASEKEISDALEHQKTYFEKYRIQMTLGDVLVENKVITQTDRLSILLTQNRIKDENLLDALNDLGETQIQKDAVNKRFGVLAIKRKGVSIAQVNAALEVQKNEKDTQKKSRFIGQILQEITDLTAEDTLQILQEQKQFEKRRLDLEKALYTVKSEIKLSKKLNRLFEYSVSKDGLEAYVKKRTDQGEKIPVYEFLIWLRRVGIVFGVAEDSILEAFLQKADKKTQFTAARGIPPESSTPERIQFFFKNELTPEPVPPDVTDSNPSTTDPLPQPEMEETLLIIKKNSCLAQIIPGESGKPGKDVFGRTLQPDPPARCGFYAGSGVVQKGPDFFARTDGHPVLKNSTTLVVEPVANKTEIKIITGDIGMDTQETYLSEKVEMNGTLSPGAFLRCRSLTLRGNCLGSVDCSGHLDIQGDIGTVDHPADIVCKGSVKASRRIINSKIQTQGALLAIHSTLEGSEITACKGMTIRDCLNSDTRNTILQFGLKPGDKILALDHTIETRRTELSMLKSDASIEELTLKYTNELAAEELHQFEQTVLKNFVELLEAPELYQHEGLEAKIRYLKSLPDYSSIKAAYLKPVQTKPALDILQPILATVDPPSFENVLTQLKKRLDQAPAGETTVSNTYRIETEYKARMAALQQEIAARSEDIDKIENELKGLEALKSKLGSIPVPSGTTIKIRNKCEKGTLIKGRVARLVVPETLYNVQFSEKMDPRTRIVSIVVET